MDNEEIMFSYADNPKVNQGWMNADNPWQFLAACIELKRFREWQASHFNDAVDFNKIDKELTDINIDPYGYESHLECFIDGL